MMRIRIPALLVVLTLTACKPHQPQEVPSLPASPDNPAPAPSAPVDATGDPARTPVAPVQPAPDAPPPTDPSATPKPTASAAAAPAVGSMKAARPSAKMSVAVDLRYQFDGAMVDGQPTTLHLAAIPRVTGNNFNVHVNPAPGLEIRRGSLSVQKVDATSVYRQQVSVIRRAAAPANLRVQVTMDMPEGTAFGFFTIPLETDPLRDGNTARKLDSVKQR